ncbi:MAG: malonyl-CoA synthase, partial [Alphaproteobacteria bacterium]|nr:malonyl-CoA synthase [Alphaproteobacteria bacterium]
MSGTNHLFGGIRDRTPDAAKTFLEAAGGMSLSYGALIEWSGSYANVLASLGLRPGDRVALQADKSIA